MDARVPLKHLRIRPRNLEDLFLELTGQELRDVSPQRLLAVWHARNLEFVRDRSTLVFNFLFPLALVIALRFIFGGQPRPLFKVGVRRAAQVPRSMQACIRSSARATSTSCASTPTTSS